MEIITDLGLKLIYFPRLLTQEQSDWAYRYLTEKINWTQDRYNFSGREVKAPRLTALYGDCDYSYSGQKKIARPWTEPLLRLKAIAEEHADVSFNALLLNWYRNGQDSVSWHADDEPELGQNPVIGSFSFGATREFKLKQIETGKVIKIPLHHGDYLVMAGQTQHYWLHTIAKTKKVDEGRVNLTFRKIIEV
jgi:alkylated DNA repair dioxygenase AlkB